MRERTDRWLGGALLVLALGLAANTILGPLVTGVITYPFSRTLLNQTLGLEAVTLVVVVPWCLVAAVLCLRRHSVGPAIALPPSAYTSYMFAQYIVGPGYATYPPAMPLHLGIFVLGSALLVGSWARFGPTALPNLSRQRRHLASGGLFLLAAFILIRYVPAASGTLTGARLPAEFADDPSMYWSIFLLDLGLVVPTTAASAVGLFHRRTWAEKALYGIAGWFTLVPVSVAAMGIAMSLNGDPNANPEQVVVLTVAAVLFAGFAAWIYRPLLGETGGSRL